MRIFVETNGGTCSFTNEEVDILVGIQEGRKNLLMSRNALEYALRLLNAVEGNVPASREVPRPEVNHEINISDYPVGSQKIEVTPRPPAQNRIKTPPQKVENKNVKAQGREFINELMKQKDSFYKEQDDVGKGEQIFNNSIIKKAIHEKKRDIAKDVMVKVLKTAGLYRNEEMFDSLYNGVLPEAIENRVQFE